MPGHLPIIAKKHGEATEQKPIIFAKVLDPIPTQPDYAAAMKNVPLTNDPKFEFKRPATLMCF
jgi:hypothetical protein